MNRRDGVDSLPSLEVKKEIPANTNGRQLHKQQIGFRSDLEFASTKADLRLNGKD
jgi:hypothetical protein